MEYFPLKNSNSCYQFLDCGDSARYERFGPYRIVRPCARALWPRSQQWVSDATFTREDKKGWQGQLPASWQIDYLGLKLLLKPTDFGHLGLFPEHHLRWQEMDISRGDTALNIFAYTGATSLYLAQQGATVTHVDASKPAVDWARENADLNGISTIRWITDDAMKFLKREQRRGHHYDWILLDPPTFGRGPQGQVFKVEEQINELLSLCHNLLSSRAKGLLITSHTLEFTPQFLQIILRRYMKGGTITAGENLLEAKEGESLPLGTYAWWRP